MQHSCLNLVIILLAVVSVADAQDSSPVAQSGTRPNIVVILADDFGVGDIQALYPDNKIQTPCLDQLVREGMTFTDAHSPSAVCSPTRYGILTGRYSWRTRMQEWVIAAYEPPLIAAAQPTLPGFLRGHGYHTACIGKWHLGWDWQGPQKPMMAPLERNIQKNLQWDFTQPIGGGPTARGFDYYFGVVLPNMPPFCWIENDRVTVQPTDKYEYSPEQGTVMPRGFEGCPMAPGWKFDEILPGITNRAVAWIKERAHQDEPFFLYFAQTSPHEPISPSPEFLGKSGIAPIADFVMETDWSAGQVIKAIDDAGISDNTIVIFTADNGHSHYTGWEKLIEAGHWPSGPYRGHKGDVWEGGHRVPLIVRWPKTIAANSTSDQLVCLTDFYATFAELLDAELTPAEAPDSFSFLGSATGQQPERWPARTSVINHSNFGEFAFRDGPLKLVYKNVDRNLGQSRGKPRIPELYDLSNDIAETTNLVDTQSARLGQMTEQLSRLVRDGFSRPGASGNNDCPVRFDTTQKFRWIGE